MAAGVTTLPLAQARGEAPLAVSAAGGGIQGAPPARLERASEGLVGNCSLQLSYGGMDKRSAVEGQRPIPAGLFLCSLVHMDYIIIDISVPSQR